MARIILHRRRNVSPSNPLSATTSKVDVACRGNSTGSATIIAAGGSPPYTYLWNTGATTASITNKAAGTYTVTVTDSAAASVPKTIIISQPAAVLSASQSQTDVSVFGGSNGAASVTPSGGTSPYTYLWNTGATTSGITGLIAGSYSVTITDFNGCTLVKNFTITQPVDLTASQVSTNVGCFGASTGTAGVTASGGTAPYTYLWDHGPTTASVTSLAAGNYSVTITDAALDTVVKNFTITQPVAALSATQNQTNVDCRGNSTGSATVVAANGTAPYTYLWSGGGTSATKTGLAAGAHSVTITDANGCTLVKNFTITQPAAVLSATPSQTNILCYGASTGQASVVAAGGTTPYTYAWSGGGTSSSKTGLAAGAHSVTITDANGCQLVQNFTLTQPTQLTASSFYSDVTVVGASDGTASVTPSGGTPSYTYLWSTSATTSGITGLAPGSYYVDITDANGCVLRVNFTISNALAAGEFAYTIPSTNQTSAGVYDGSGNLVRTLWSNVSKTANTYTGTWDGKNDAGATVSAGTYTAKVRYNAITYTWQTPIGNYSSATYGSTVMRGLRGIQGAAVYGSYIYYVTGFNEGNTSQYKTPLADPHTKTDIIPPQNGDFNMEFQHVCTDGTIVYWTGFDPHSSGRSLTMGTYVSNDNEVQFSSGTSIQASLGRFYNWAIGASTTLAARPTGIAVNSTYIFVSRGGQNKISVYNKTTGAFVRDITSLTNVRQSVVDPNGFLWVITSTSTVTKYTINANGTITTTGVTLSGLVRPLSISASPDGTTVAVVDGSTSQQLKGFDTTSGGAASWTLGTSGGGYSNSAVSDTKFMFDHPVMNDLQVIHPPYVAYKPDGGFILGDSGNMRSLVHDNTRAVTDTFGYLKMLYQVSADSANDDRIFADWLEFDRTTGDLVANWAEGLTTDYIYPNDIDTRDTFNNCMTFSNGRTYASVTYVDPVTEIRYPEIVELVSGGTVRFTGIRLLEFQKFNFDTSGNIYYISGDTQAVGSTLTCKKRTLTGFDGSNNPTWGAASTIYTFPSLTTQHPLYLSYTTPVITTSGKLVVFGDHKDAPGMHLGAVAAGTAAYVWQTSKANATSYSGNFPTDGTFDRGNGVVNGYAGGDLVGADDHVFWNYIGEFWQNSQVNKWHHYYEDGLMLGQFGKTGPEAQAIDGVQAPREMAGNAFSTAIQKSGSDYYIYHGDESIHGGVHVWKVSNLASMGLVTTSVVRP